MITVLAGGIGAARFLQGLAAVWPPEDITVIANTGDDAIFHGLHVSPDIDTVLYTLAGWVDPDRGWGIGGDTFHVLAALQRLGEDAWFQLGDRDLATHLFRTERLKRGATLSEVTWELCERLNVRCRVLPMTNDPAATRLHTAVGELSFQEYFVKLRQEPEVRAMDLSAAEHSTPAPGVIESITRADSVVVAPSNPILSIGPILAVPGVREALRATNAPVAAISPIVAGKALKGPAARNLASLGFTASAASVAELYSDFLDIFIVDEQDAALCPEIRAKGMQAVSAPTIMSSIEAKKKLADAVLSALSGLRKSEATSSGRA